MNDVVVFFLRTVIQKVYLIAQANPTLLLRNMAKILAYLLLSVLPILYFVILAPESLRFHIIPAI